ncbi:putative toxin-antitoxin system toxin component, PIN family [Noviherbaspirillum sedimenti]|uniref:Putative toxin-antitoxin system toxin component, PIN family n=1 Tax=Noviherbaspirillum sedimenti TaxID=2320865 RepID=A0A3A3G416_9BURK|nr:putative toxin-antitoxin system toxin component, PIN family [Noviherbaspirillum sedimenti]RJG01242.1 putative toxin-antitoxin system toxin component, PIN family [Noviherbaspirillum sedimenti]
MIPNRVILDTNVCLDLFVFHDPRWQNLLAALRDGRVHAVTRADCRREWQIVLGYEHLRLDEAARARCEASFDALIGLLPEQELTPLTDIRLPLCRDTDDQKFLELARDARADVLITKDKALLKLARKNAKSGLFRIIAPEAWALAA